MMASGRWRWSVPSGDTRRIVRVDAAHSTAALSPDGRHIVFDGQPRDGNSNGRRDLFIVGVGEPAEPMPLVTGRADDAAPLWTRDGLRVAFISDRTGEPGIWVVPVRNGHGADRRSCFNRTSAA